MDTVEIYSQPHGLNSDTLIQNRMTVENAFCFGNGKSRLEFDMDSIKDKGMTFGCNGIYRDMKVDHLICLDNQITHEIYRSGYCYDNNTYHINDYLRRVGFHSSHSPLSITSPCSFIEQKDIIVINIITNNIFIFNSSLLTRNICL